MKEITKEWVAKADNDFYSADMLLHSGDVPMIDTACFIAGSVRKNISRLICKNIGYDLNGYTFL